MNVTTIGWTDFSSNLLKYRNAAGKVVFACAKTSPGCVNCYAEAIGQRFDRGGPFSLAVVRTVTPFFDEDEARKILRSKKLTGKRCFTDDMTDLFGDWVPDEIIDRHFAAFALRPDVTFQVLTKRAERMEKYASTRYIPAGVDRALERMGACESLTARGGLWPLPNVWLGVSVEDQLRADERLPYLINTPAAVRFISAEPLLGQVRLRHDFDGKLVRNWLGEGGVNWVIIGGESGHSRRPCEVAWVQSVADQCRAASVACYVKQDAGPRPGMQGRLSDALWALKEFPEAR